MEKIDKRRHYIIVLDTETTNTRRTDTGQLDTSDVLMYDCGWCVMDTKGNIYEERSYINSDIFYESELMRSAYYAKKIPMYKEQIKSGERILTNTYNIRKQMLEDIKKYSIKEVCAHNARFDYRALQNIQRWTTKSKFRYWMPCGIIWWDSLKMARDIICKMPTYRKFCEANNLLTKNGTPSATAESLYKFITKNPNFIESHTGLEDVRIEREIILYCYKQHKKMRKILWE